MNANDWTADEQCNFLEKLAAELTDAAHSVAIQHERTHLWLDLELNLRRTLSDTVKKGAKVSNPWQPIIGIGTK